MLIRIECFCDPIPLARPRFSGRRAYLPERSRRYREILQADVRAQLPADFVPFEEDDLICRLKFYRKFRPSSRRFGDIDNLSKAALDAAQGIIFADDAKIISLSAEKFQDERPRTEILFETKKAGL